MCVSVYVLLFSIGKKHIIAIANLCSVMSWMKSANKGAVMHIYLDDIIWFLVFIVFFLTNFNNFVLIFFIIKDQL